MITESPDRERRFWTDVFENKPVPHPHCKRKPDGVQVPQELDPKKPESFPGWNVFDGTFEAKSTLAARLEAIFQCAGSARMTFNSQLDRRYCLGYTLSGEWLSVIAFDRSGWVASPPFNIHEDPGMFLHVMVGSLYLEQKKFGLDPTVEIRGESKRIEVDGEWYNIIDVIHVEGVLRGRATICYHVRKDGQDYVVKDCWVDASRTDREADILEKLKGLEHVPEVIKNVPVLFEGKPDTTAHFRRSRNKDGSPGTYKSVEIREHRRMLLKPLARKLSDFRDLVELLTALRDIVDSESFHYQRVYSVVDVKITGIENILERGYIHRDISIANVMLEEKGDDLRGLLIDYDYAIDKDRAMTQAVGRRTVMNIYD